MAINGSCYCGAIEYTMVDQGEQSRSGVSCLCRTCQKLHTSASYNVKSSPEDIKVTKGTPKRFDDTKTDSGKAIHRYFCGDCGSQLWADPDSMEGVRFVKAGPLDNVQEIKHVVEIYHESGLPHTRSNADGLTVYEGMMAKKIKG